MVVRTRFAPSPTGSLHLGSARTAFFNWLYARHCGGDFLLRIEDTDQERSKQEWTEQIMQALSWMGITTTKPVVVQSTRTQRHREVVQQLIDKGLAYYCYCSQEELEAMRAEALSQKRPPMYDRRWRDQPASKAPSGVSPVVRLKTPLEGETVLEDKVQGRIIVQNNTLDDLVLLRSDGTPTYMLAVVVDDHDMEVTHIIRGDDHLTNAFRQICIYKALGWHVPQMAHIPLIHGPDGAKLSKRHGAASVEEYRAMGILPEALLNALLRLGWSHQDEEYIAVQQAIAWFDFDGLGRSAARFDEKKLLAMNAHYMRQKDPSALLADVTAFSGKKAFTGEAHAKALAILPELVKRAQTLADLSATLPIYTEKLLEKRPPAQVLPEGLLSFLEGLDDWSAAGLEADIRAFAQKHGCSVGDIAKPLRLLLTGQAVSPSLFSVMEVLGKAWTLARLSV